MPLEFQNLTPGAHICLIYRDAQEQREVISRFLASGIRQKEKVSYFADVSSHDDILAWVRGMDLDEAELTSGAFNVLSSSAAYHPEGYFSPQAMYDRIESFAANAIEMGFSAARLTGETSWALKGIPGAERLLEYEEGLNRILPKCDVSAMCQYNASEFDSAFLMRVIKIHPMIVINRTLVKNPYFILGHRG